MMRAEPTLAFLDTMEKLSSDPDILAQIERDRRVARAALDIRLITAIVMLPTDREQVDSRAFEDIAHAAADISEEYDLEPEEMQTVLEMCENGLEAS